MHASEDLETVREFQQANKFGGFFDFDIPDELASVDDCRREDPDPAVESSSLWRDGDGSVARADDGLHGLSDGRRRSTTTTTTTTNSDDDMRRSSMLISTNTTLSSSTASTIDHNILSVYPLGAVGSCAFTQTRAVLRRARAETASCT